MLSTAKSTNIGFSQVVQICPTHKPCCSPCAENSFYKFWKKNYSGCQQCGHKY